jgi:4-diphosphocytidyl-2-C-methyl-D-erythritol kinase
LALVLARPPIEVATAGVFGALPPAHYTTGAATAALLSALAGPGAPVAPDHWPLHNALQQTTCRLYPVVDEVLAALKAAGAHLVLMSGSGPTCFGLYATPGQAAGAAAAMERRGWQAWAVTAPPASEAAGGLTGDL